MAAGKTKSSSPRKRRRPVHVLTAAAQSEQELERQLWSPLQAHADASVRFWNAFFALRCGAAPLRIDHVDTLCALVRAICWVETKHGTFVGGASHGDVDVMQCADTRNPWWAELLHSGPQSDRFVGGPSRGNWWPDELPAAAAQDPAFDPRAAFATLKQPEKGSADSGFKPVHSLFWGVPLLLEKMNGAAGSRTYQCGDLSRERLLAGAGAYNGGGDPHYEQKVAKALKLIGEATVDLNAAAAAADATSAANESGHAPKPQVISRPSPNHASRQGNVIQYLILHNTDGTLQSALQRLTDPSQSVSSHYVVDRSGKVYQLVPDSETAWHAGNKAVNQQSIGIEVVASSRARGMTSPQNDALIALARFVVDAYDIPLKNVLPHRRVRIGGTDCPGWVWPTDTELEAWARENLTL